MPSATSPLPGKCIARSQLSSRTVLTTHDEDEGFGFGRHLCNIYRMKFIVILPEPGYIRCWKNAVYEI